MRLKVIVELHAKIVNVGRTSLTIDITAYKLCFKCSEPTLVASASAVFVALNDDGKPEPIIADPMYEVEK